MSPISREHVPPDLVESILAGRCIAFVGAGFSQPAVPAWSALLEELARRFDVSATLPANATALEYELLGQLLREKARTDAAFETEVQAVLHAFHHDATRASGRAIVERRCQWLRSIPFKAILTTNFDPWLPGTHTDAATYWKVLRQTRGRWWEFPVRSTDPHPDVPIIKLHGDANGDPDVAGLVLGRADYRRRVYGEHGYTSFIRAAFASYTVLFLGVSFTDAYLNELRSETLQLLGGASRDHAPWGYAVMKLDPERQAFAQLFRSHEGIEILPMDTFDHFDDWLGSIAARTAARERLRELLAGKRIVWIDRRPANNEIGKELFSVCGADIETLTSSDQLTSAHASADLIITQFGFDLQGSCAYRVLDRLRAEPSRAPVIVFASPDGPVESNRRECIRRGAWEYATQWSELYRLIEMLMSSGR